MDGGSSTFRSYAATLAIATVVLAANLAIYAWAGLLPPETVPEGFSSPEHLLGLVILLAIVPSYIIVTQRFLYRRTREIAGDVSPQLMEQVSGVPWLIMAAWIIAGLGYAVVFNIPQSVLEFFSLPPDAQALVYGQLVVWGMTFGLLGWRVRCARLVDEAGLTAPYDLFEPGKLRPFAQSGLGDVLVLAGGLVLSTVQSIDANFRWVNYVYAMAVLLPAMIYVAVKPMINLHRRMRADRLRQIAAVNALIRAASKALEPAAVAELESLLQRRERLTALSTWPADLSLVQRFLLYLVIPPLAWVGAEIVELMLEGVVG